MRKFLSLILMLASSAAFSGELVCYPSGVNDDMVCETQTKSYYCYQEGDTEYCEEE